MRSSRLPTVIASMKGLGVFLCSILTLSSVTSHHVPHPTGPGLCEDTRLQCNESLIGSYCPQCDSDGNFLPQQCWPSTGYCWCVDVMSGEEIPHTNTPPGTPRVNCDQPEPWHCPDGWFGFGETCFTFIDSPKKWIEAEVYCQFDGANLASIHSEEENHFIMSLTRGYTQNFPQTWLGGFDAIHPGYWMWSDGSDFSYENWYDNPYGERSDHDDDDHHDDKDHDDDDKDHDDNDKDHDDDDKDHDDDDKDHDDDDKDHDDDDKDHDDENDHDHHEKPPKENHTEKSCLKINYEYDLKWFHDSCNNYLPFVCAKKLRRIH